MRSRNLLLFISIFALQTSLFAQTQREMEVGFNWVSLEEAQVEAAESGKKILLFGYAEWCTFCLKTRKETFPDSSVIASITEFYIPVQLDAESDQDITYNGKTMPEYELARYLRLSSYPIHYFLDSEGELIGAQPGFIEPFVYGPLLDYVGSDAYKNQSFEEYFDENDTGDGN